MGLIIFLRKRLTENKFREVVLDSINTGTGNKVILCSGFYQENWFRNPSYEVSSEGSLDQILKNNNIELTTVGVHNAAWVQAYKNFRNNLRSKGVNITSKISKSYHWHAKIFILKMDDKPILGIVGSSNMTKPAFGISGSFNFESDVFMWIDNNIKISNIMNTLVSDLGQFNDEIIIADYDVDKNFGLTIEDRLKQLERGIFEVELNDLEE